MAHGFDTLELLEMLAVTRPPTSVHWQ
ncbi:hypothetical protein AB0G66_10260 [Streptomyces lydicus]